MTDIEGLYQRLRATDPAATADTDPSSPTALQVRTRALGYRPVRHSRTPRKRIVLLAAATLLLFSGVSAIATVIFEVNPEDGTILLEAYSEEKRVHLEGWRPELSTETVWCVYEQDVVAHTPVAEFPLSEPMSMKELLDECRGGNDAVRLSGRSITALTPCEALVPADVIAERLSSTGDRLIAGDLTGDRYRFPVILAWGADCDAVGLQTKPQVQLRTLTSLDAINHARAVEASLKAAAIQRCLTQEEAHALAHQARDHLSKKWLVVAPNGASPRCRTVSMDPWGIIMID